jgi:hypothetical protein
MEQPKVTYIVNPYDDHVVHMEEHRMQQKQPEYQRAKLEDFETFTLREVAFMEHNKQHSAFYAQEMAAQERRMAKVIEMRKGAGGGGK